jgi:heptosyltransferase-2
MAALFSECDAVLTNDSGPMHVAYAVMAPLVAIFGSTDPALTGLPEGSGIVIDKHVPCSPCFLRNCRKKRAECMEAVTAEEAFSAVKSLLPKRRAVFFDRDGTLCEDADYLSRWEDFKVLPEVESVNELKNKGYLLIGISNQSGIARGLIEEPFVKEVNGFFVQKHGFDGFYYCPHHPDEHCQCRKPEPGLALQARMEHKIDLKGSFVIGDTDRDMLLARAVGAKAVLVQTGKQKESPYADFTVRGLKEAVGIISGL